MSGASHILDPVEAAKDDILRSKHLIASTLDDLSRHHSWLEGYHREERRRAERLKRQETLRRLERKRQRAAWRLRRSTTAAVAVTRTTGTFVFSNGKAFLVWATPRAHTLALTTFGLLSAGSSWSWRTARALARDGFDAAQTGLAWTVQMSDAAGVAFRRQVAAFSAAVHARATILAAPGLKRASAGWTRTRLRTRRLASTLEARFFRGWSETQNAVSRWTMTEGPRRGRVLAREAATAIAHMRSQAELHARATLEAATNGWARTAKRPARPASEYRALIIRKPTALVCFEPRRAILPVVYAR